MHNEEMFFDVVKAFNYARDFCADQGGCDICENRKYGKNCDFASMAEHLYNAGYRKASDVAREIFAEIEQHLEKQIKAILMFGKDDDDFYSGELHAINVLQNYIADIKKKYIGEDIKVLTNTGSEGAE